MRRLIPELDVSDLARSLAFYVDIVGFKVLYDRSDERFTFLDLDGVHLMLQEAAGPGRRFRTAPMEYPYGRGVNLQIEVIDVDAVLGRLRAAALDPVIPMEERWYRRDKIELGAQQFVAADPDGYLLRFYSVLGRRAAAE